MFYSLFDKLFFIIDICLTRIPARQPLLKESSSGRWQNFVSWQRPTKTDLPHRPASSVATTEKHSDKHPTKKCDETHHCNCLPQIRDFSRLLQFTGMQRVTELSHKFILLFIIEAEWFMLYRASIHVLWRGEPWSFDITQLSFRRSIQQLWRSSLAIGCQRPPFSDTSTASRPCFRTLVGASQRPPIFQILFDTDRSRPYSGSYFPRPHIQRSFAQ